MAGRHAGRSQSRGKTLRAAIVAAPLGILVSFALLLRETPYTLVAFMFVGQPLLVIAFLLLAFQVFQDLRNRGVLGPPPALSPS